MPTLHLRLIPTSSGGKNKVILSIPIRSQKLMLKSATVLKPNTTGYTDGSVKISLPCLSANHFHSNDRKGFISIHVDASSRYTSHSFGSGLKLDADHIDQIFTATLCNASGEGITSSDVTEVHFLFDYRTHQLFDGPEGP